MVLRTPRPRTILLTGTLGSVCALWLSGYFGTEAKALMLSGWLLALFYAMLPVCREKLLSRENVGCGLLASLFAFFRVMGFSYEKTDSYALVCKSMRTLASGALAMLALAVLTFCALGIALFAFRRCAALARDDTPPDGNEKRRLFVFCALVVFCGSLPYLLLYWPGLNIYDTHDQILQFFGFPSYIGDGSALSDHHPVFLTVIYGGFMKLGLLLGNANIGQAAYSLLSMAAIACAFAYAFVTLRECGLGAKTVRLLAVGVAVYPVLALYAFNMCKDVSIEPFVLVYLSQMLRMEKTHGQALQDNRFAALFAGNLLLMMLTRKPSAYALAFALPFLLLRWRAVWKRLCALTVSALLIFMIGVQGVLLPALGVVPGEGREMLSVPFQQTVRSLLSYPQDAREEELTAISRVIDVDYALSHYNSILSDPVKDTSNPDVTGAELAGYAKTWLSMGLRHPGAYADAFLNLIYGYFYPSDRNTIVCLTLSSPDEGGVLLRQAEGLSGLRLWLHDFIYLTLRHIPGVGWLFYVDTVTWMFLALLLALMLSGGAGAAYPFMFFVGTLGIALLGPKMGEIRYLMPILYSLPVLLGFALAEAAPQEEKRGKNA